MGANTDRYSELLGVPKALAEEFYRYESNCERIEADYANVGKNIQEDILGGAREGVRAELACGLQHLVFVIELVDGLDPRLFLYDVVGRQDGKGGIHGRDGKMRDPNLLETVDILFRHGDAARQIAPAFFVVYALRRDHTRPKLLDWKIDHGFTCMVK